MSHLTPEIKARVEQKLRQCCEIATRQTGVEFAMPHIMYGVRGTTAGKAHLQTYTVDFNAMLLAENVDAFIARTVPHEMAHLIDYKLHPENFRRGVGRGKRSVHGPSWKRIMMMLGADPSRCHSYDTTHSKVKKSGGTQYWWVCRGCGKKASLGPQRHRKQLNADGNMYFLRGCSRHGGMRYISATKPESDRLAWEDGSFTKAADTATPKAPAPAPRGGQSKYDRCRSIYIAWRQTADRKRMIGLFIGEAGCTPAGAATYYAKLKKEIG